MRYWFCCCAWLLMTALPAWAAEVSVSMVVWPPGAKLAPGVSVLLRVKGLSSDQEIVWHRIPDLDTDAVVDWSDGKVLLFCGQEPGRRSFLAQLPGPGLDELLRVDFLYGEWGPPPPDPPPPPPPPDPPPPPPPPGPVARLTVVVVEESTQRTPQHFQTWSYPPLLKWMRQNGHRLRLVEKDVKDEMGRVPTDLAQYITRAGGDLPAVFFVDENGRSMADKPLPLPGSGPAFLMLLKRWGLEQ